MLNRRDFLKKACFMAAGAGVGGLLLSGGCSSGAEAKPALKEAAHYKKLKDGTVQCLLCPFTCKIPRDASGICRVRKNRNGKLYSLVYGRPVTIHVDPVEKKPFYHFLPGTEALSLATVGCNLRCSFCQNWEISQATPGSQPEYDGPPAKIVEKAVSSKAPSIACTYTEPIVFFEYTRDIARAAAPKGIKTIMISAGFINKKPLLELCKVLSAIKVDLKAFDDDFYRDLVQGRLKPVLNTLVTIRNAGVWLEIVNLLIPGKNDSHAGIKKMCGWIKENLGADTPLHFTRFYPLYKLNNIPPTPAKTLETARKIGIDSGLNFVYVGNLPGHPGNNTYCPNCGKLIIERLGYNTKKKKFKDGKCGYCGMRIPGVWK